MHHSSFICYVSLHFISPPIHPVLNAAQHGASGCVKVDVGKYALLSYFPGFPCDSVFALPIGALGLAIVPSKFFFTS
jgi:hypothetical protein